MDHFATRSAFYLRFTATIWTVILCLGGANETAAQVEVLAGSIGSTTQWGSGWIDLATPRDFSTGDQIRIRVGGTARKVLVRLLPRGVPPDVPQWIIGGIRQVPQSRVLQISLQSDYKGVVQVSVHGGPNPWDRFRDHENGPATIEEVAVIRGGRRIQRR